jgi:hypothetical protein
MLQLPEVNFNIPNGAQVQTFPRYNPPPSVGIWELEDRVIRGMPEFRDDITPAFEDVHDFHEHVFDELCQENFMEEPVGSKDLLPPMVRLVSIGSALLCKKKRKKKIVEAVPEFSLPLQLSTSCIVSHNSADLWARNSTRVNCSRRVPISLGLSWPWRKWLRYPNLKQP